MQTKDEIREEYRIVTCDGLYRIQWGCDGVWLNLVNGCVFPIAFLPHAIFQTSDLKEAKSALKRLVDRDYRAQDDAWKPI
jgi:hypothetical protein